MSVSARWVAVLSEVVRGRWPAASAWGVRQGAGGKGDATADAVGRHLRRRQAPRSLNTRTTSPIGQAACAASSRDSTSGSRPFTLLPVL